MLNSLGYINLASVASISMGQSPEFHLINKDEIGIPFIQGCAEFGRIHPNSPFHCSKPIRRARSGSVLISVRAPVGTINVADQEYCIGRGIASVHATASNTNAVFLRYAIESSTRFLHRRSQGSTFLAVSAKDLAVLPIPAVSLEQQCYIAEILSTLDSAIEQTQALIAKLVSVREGLISDLFIRGLRDNGRMRPEQRSAPSLFASSPLGWIPIDWKIQSIDQIAESLIDGPFGSNLKSEHYVDDPGVRVVRLQNVGSGTYSDADKAFVSQRHAAYLSRHQVLSGDVLVAGLGDEAHPVGRSCCYPAELPPAINKADCFRLRCEASQALNPYVMLFLNTLRARHQVRRYEQGVTRLRINLGNLRRIQIPLPTVKEQHMVVERVAAVTADIEAAVAQYEKALATKQGLRVDLLSGCVAFTGC